MKPGIDVACGAILEGCCACFAFLSSPFSQEPCPSIPSADSQSCDATKLGTMFFLSFRCTSTLVLSNHHLLFYRLHCQLDLWEAGVGFKHAQCLTFATQLKPGGPCDSSNMGSWVPAYFLVVLLYGQRAEKIRLHQERCLPSERNAEQACPHPLSWKVKLFVPVCVRHR